MCVTTLKHLVILPYIPNTILKSRIKILIQCCFSNKNGEQRYQYLVIDRDKFHFVKNHSKYNHKYKQAEIIAALDFFYLQHNCPIWWTGVSTNDCYSNGYAFCSATCRFVSTRLWSLM
jgi:hypothetical protein